MLVALLDSAKDCYRRAAEAHNRAVMTRDREYRLFLLQMERRWIRLAQHFEAGQRIETFVIQRGSAE
jgi:hypothetical protein